MSPAPNLKSPREDVDFEQNIALVLGKGRRQPECPFGRRTAQALDRYLRARPSHRDKDRPEFWLGLAGPMTPNGARLNGHARDSGLGPL